MNQADSSMKDTMSNIAISKGMCMELSCGSIWIRQKRERKLTQSRRSESRWLKVQQLTDEVNNVRWIS